MKKLIKAARQAREELQNARDHIWLLPEKAQPLTEKQILKKLQAAISVVSQAIKEAEKQEPTAIGDEWKPCVKLPIVVHVREQRKGETHISTREGITPVKEDDLIMRGVAGEEYPIGRELFNQTYTFDTAPVHASGISQERVDETAKDRHELAGTIPISNGGIATRTPSSFISPPKRKWVGLTEEELCKTVLANLDETLWTLTKSIEAKLKEKNT